VDKSRKAAGGLYVKPNLFDKIVHAFNPLQGEKRLKARMGFAAMEFVGNPSRFAGGNSPGYRIPGQNRQALRGWFTSMGSANADSLSVLPGSRAAVRDLCMNTPVATAILRRAKTNVVGPGLQMQSRIDREFLGMSDPEADAWEKKTEREFRHWAGSQECDITRTQTFYDLQALAFLSTLMNGDVFALLPMVQTKSSPYSLKVKLVEGDQCLNENEAADTPACAGGIEIDKNGAPAFYHFRKTHPGEINTWDYTWEKIPAFGAETGRRNVLHLLVRERVGQSRGMPILAPVIEKLKQLSRLDEAELMAAVIAAMYTVFITTPTGENPFGDGFYPGDTSGTGENESIVNKDARPSDENKLELGQGTVVTLAEGETIETAAPSRPNAAYAPYFEALVKQIGASIGMPFEVVMQHFTASYSASRAALIEAWKWFREQRIWLSRALCQPVYEEWLAEAVSLGRIDAPGFFDDPMIRCAWSAAIWTGPGQGQLDPLKETNASVMRVQNTLSTYEDEKIAYDGGDWGATVSRRSREEALLKSKGLIIPAAAVGITSGNEPGKTAPAGQ
jgi:lambda family phage portal protein